MDLLFLVLWPVLFIGLGGLIWKHRENRGRLYILILVNMAGLSTLFFLFPLVLKLAGRAS